ncbi:hypothetical protein DFJ58DRAFT_725046 [Suillus subalutaceus]|uniref:uncharacterized protein n=1 Tax=Suillus subalutaceus TaxID=48586 RepID=UPI001B86C13C|nr:uncharacterized protein DFJ58DRAFT_725046 [Suillus subalutaceus]KAG1863620.1 hypothetical protein DFJ58DRAFT_725046 [Suillus subalutaceus]
MASYDSASTSHSVSSPPIERHRLRRKRSPSPSSQHFSVNPFAAHRTYSPSTRASDIARLLDPAYASPSHQTAFKALGRTAIREVYVDHHGDLHDPDFRDFPTFGHAHSKPSWEQTYADESDAEEDEGIYQRRASIEKQRRRPSTTAYYASPAYYPYDEPSSYESRNLAEVEDEDEQLDHQERAPLKEKCFATRSKSPEKTFQTEKETYPENLHIEVPQSLAADGEWTPTCGHAIRRQWHAFTLSLRFSLFRTKRRIQRRMSS